VITDNPHLIPRGNFPGYRSNPMRIICGEQELPSDANIFDGAATTQVVKTRDLDLLIEKLNDFGINQVLVEAGPTLASAMLDHCLMDELVMYQAPSLLGSGKSFFTFGEESTIENQLRMDHISTEVLDGDVKSVYRIRNGE
jgi:diaminohydroxyphosphoribosylaminopyrimidine deaminase/5-amino-6-(5-phosphoribosylamino)uracil reductase